MQNTEPFLTSFHGTLAIRAAVIGFWLSGATIEQIMQVEPKLSESMISEIIDHFIKHEYEPVKKQS
jgi:uncharacterized protein YneF (UPF0154 family)